MCVRECVFKLSRKLRLCVQAGSYITTGRQREREEIPSGACGESTTQSLSPVNHSLMGICILF